MTTATIKTPADVLADIERQLTDLGEPGDVLNTDNAQAAYHGKRSALWNHRRAITDATATLAKVAPKIAADEKWLADLTMWRKTLSDELLAITSPIRDARIMAKAENLHLSIRMLDHGRRVSDDSVGYVLLNLRLGQLMRESGYVAAPPMENTNQFSGPMPWFGTLGEVEGRLKELREQRDEAQMRLDAALPEV
jgi:hypothetical protein